MDKYLRFFNVDEIKTEEVSSSYECNEIHKINEENATCTLFHNNVRSINKNIDEISIFLAQQKNPFDCIVLTETHQIDNLDKYNIPGYNLIYNYGKVNKFDGTGVYLKENITHNVNVMKFHDVAVIKLEVNFNNKKMLILALYRSPSLPQIEFITDLQQYLAEMKKSYDYQIIVEI